ncbi:murein biosynthesis integral membrane protein MurJ [Brevibacillus sp. B_LB10_24]|uniref:murein biosynthesis integral membrane protein MurJ n=1 Tax=Brevibacillus sp. B_LB10_24 TaxID=3380645 RepID=UPI0038B8C360
MSRFQRIVAMVFVITLIGRALGFVRNMFVSSAYGTSTEAGAYFTAVAIPMTLFIVFPTVINSLFIPTMKGIMASNDEGRGRELYSKMLTLTVIVGGAISLLGWLGTDAVTSLLVPGWDAEAKGIVSTQLAWMWPSVFFIALLSLWSTMLNAHDRFFASTLSTVVNSAVTILGFVVLVPWLGSIGLAISTTIGFILAAATVLPPLRKLNYSFRWNFHWRGDPALRSMGERLFPIFIAIILGQVTVFFEKIIASGLGNEKISALAYAMTIIQLPMMVVGAATVPLFPLLSEHVKRQNLPELKRILCLGLRYLTVLMVPVTVGLFLVGKPLIELLYQKNQFGPEDTQLTYWALIFYGVGLFATAARDLFTRTFYALENTKTPVVYAGINVAIYICLGLLLVPYLDHGGIALAMSLSAFLNVILLGLALRRKIGGFVGRELYETAGKTLIGVAVMAVALSMLEQAVHFSHAIVSFSFFTAVGAVIYGAVLYLAKEPLLAELLGRVLARLPKKQRG